MTLSTLVPPAEEVLDSSDAVLRQWLKLMPDETEEDELIDELAASARQKVESHVRRRLVTQTVRLGLDGFCGHAIPLEVAPVASVAAVAYKNDAGVWTTLDAARYQLIDTCLPFELHPAYGQIWPVPRVDAGTVRIDLVVGYGSAEQVPPVFRQAIRRLTSHFYYNRDRVEEGRLPAGIADLLFPEVFWV